MIAPSLVLRLLTVTAPVPAVASELRSTAPVVVSAEMLLPVSSRAEVLPMPEAALRSIVPVPTLMSAPASAPDSLIAPTLLIVTRSASAVTDPTSTLPLVSVVNVMFLLVPPAVSVVAVRSPPVAVTLIEPLLVLAVVIVVVASLVITRSPAPPVMVALVTFSPWPPV